MGAGASSAPRSAISAAIGAAIDTGLADGTGPGPTGAAARQDWRPRGVLIAHLAEHRCPGLSIAMHCYVRWIEMGSWMGQRAQPADALPTVLEHMCVS